MNKQRIVCYPTIICIFSVLFVFQQSCSLDYSSIKPKESRAPEFIFNNLHMTKIENDCITATVTSDLLEQYREENSQYAKNVQFTLLNDAKQIKVEGSCNLIAVDNKNDVYTLLDKVNITSYEQNMLISTNYLQFNNKTEQLVGDKNDYVTISNVLEEKKINHVVPKNKPTSQMILSGKGFAASGVSQTYSFADKTEGTVISQSNKRDKK